MRRVDGFWLSALPGFKVYSRYVQLHDAAKQGNGTYSMSKATYWMTPTTLAWHAKEGHEAGGARA